MTCTLDLHIHTVYSDGVVDPLNVVKYAKRVGLNGISITDHNTLQGSLRALEAVKSLKLKEFIVIPGIEITTEYGHILVYGLTSIRRFTTVVELIDIVREENGIIALAHPYGKLLFLPYRAVETPEIIRNIDAIEIVNGKTPPISNRRARELALKLQKPGIGGSDAHTLTEIGTVRTVVEDNVSTLDEILEAIRRGRCSVEGERTLVEIVASTIKRHIQKLLHYTFCERRYEF